MRVEYVTFDTREARVRYVAGRFGPLLQGRVLDVGCDQGHLRTLRPDLEYFGIDIGGAPDMRLDLESIDRLPFADREFTVSLCIDVLEHLDNLHRIFAEMLRVTRKRAIISWHNCWVNARRPMFRGLGGFSHYGLPYERPLDRHKWFFNLSQALDFVSEAERRSPFRLAEFFVTEKPRPWIVRSLRRLRYPQQLRYLNRYAHTLWTVFERRGALD